MLASNVPICIELPADLDAVLRAGEIESNTVLAPGHPAGF
jgi:hypothetical protein